MTGVQTCALPIYRVIGSTFINRWSYSSTKAVDEHLALAYHKQYGLRVIIVRLFNTIGVKQSSDYGMVVPNFIKNALVNNPLIVHGDGTQSRCFIDVRDAVNNLIKLADSKDAVGNVVNLGSDESITILDLAKLVLELIGSTSKMEFMPYSEIKEFEDMKKRAPSLDKIKSLIDFKLEHDLNSTIKDIISNTKNE